MHYMSITKTKKIAARVRQQNVIPFCRCTQCIFYLFNMYHPNIQQINIASPKLKKR